MRKTKITIILFTILLTLLLCSCTTTTVSYFKPSEDQISLYNDILVDFLIAYTKPEFLETLYTIENSFIHVSQEGGADCSFERKVEQSNLMTCVYVDTIENVILSTNGAIVSGSYRIEYEMKDLFTLGKVVYTYTVTHSLDGETHKLKTTLVSKNITKPNDKSYILQVALDGYEFNPSDFEETNFFIFENEVFKDVHNTITR